MALLAGGAARRESVTFDELAHTAAGASYWQKLDMRMNEEHPPLSKLVAGLPLAVAGKRADYSHVSWTFSGKGPFNQYLGEWVFGYWFLMKWNDPRATLWLARCAMLLLTLCFGYVVYAIGARLGGPWGGLLCLACFVTTPAFLAFGPLVITDIAIALFWVLTVWQLANLWRSPDRATLIKFALAFAGALLSKFSAGLLFFVFPAVVLSLRLRTVPEQPSEKLARRRWRRLAWWNMLKGTAWAALFVYVVYLFFSWHQPTDTLSVIPHFPTSPILRRALMPLWIYLKGLAGFALSAGSRPTYILGHSYPHGVWFYFPVIFVLKSQLAFLLLLLLAIAVGAARKIRGQTDTEAAVPSGLELNWRCLWISLVVYFVACMLSQLDISVRHFSIAIALIILLLAPLPRMMQSMKGRYPRFVALGTALVPVLVVFAVVSAIRTYPHYLPYLNDLSLGKPGYLLVNDSNLDWNQALPEVETFAEQHGLKEFLVDAYAFSDSGTYTRNGRDWNCQKGSASDGGQWAFVSANNLVDTRNCVWLMQYPHQAIGAGSMYAVQLPAVIPAAGAPGGPPLPNDFHYLGGMGVDYLDVRDIFARCMRDPAQLEPTFNYFVQVGEERQKEKQKRKH